MRRYRAREPKYPTPEDPHWLVAIDLGKTKVGVAVFWVEADATLFWSGTVQAPRGSGPETVALLVTSAVASRAALKKPAAPHAWVCEWPEKYKLKAKFHEDLDSLFHVGYAISDLVGPWAERYAPKEWKGNVPKPAHNRRIKQELSPEEVARFTDQGHDAIDATGIGLFAAARHQRGGVT